MSPLAKRLTLILYLAIAGALFVNYLMGLGWFGRYDKIAMWVFIAFAALLGNWLKTRAEKRTPGGEALVEALDAQGAALSDPCARLKTSASGRDRTEEGDPPSRACRARWSRSALFPNRRSSNVRLEAELTQHKMSSRKPLILSEIGDAR